MKSYTISCVYDIIYDLLIYFIIPSISKPQEDMPNLKKMLLAYTKGIFSDPGLHVPVICSAYPCHKSVLFCGFGAECSRPIKSRLQLNCGSISEYHYTVFFEHNKFYLFPAALLQPFVLGWVAAAQRPVWCRPALCRLARVLGPQARGPPARGPRGAPALSAGSF